jgi:Glycosylphosphatidylinositol transamidase (GPIT), subunit GPI8
MILLLLFLVSFITANEWAVIVAGSNGWYNYRHQADACHAYQILKHGGLDEKNIITMMYDDIAFNSENPYPGNIINRPNGSNVYKGIKIDYSGRDVTPRNFLSVLRGDSQAVHGNKVLESGPDDNIFIYFTDHGATGLVAFPNDYLYADELNDTLNYMFKNNKYGKLIFYLEACESGSMFSQILPKNINIFATTASTPYESSYACYYDSTRNIYLGDVYSVNFLQNSMPLRILTETLQIQYEIDKFLTTTSTVCEYGDLSLGDTPLKDIFTSLGGTTSKIPIRQESYYGNIRFTKENSISSRDIELNYLISKYMNAKNKNKSKYVSMVEMEIESRKFYDTYFEYCDLDKLNQDNTCDNNLKIDYTCLREKINNFEKKYGRFSNYGLQYVKCLATECKTE